MINTLNRFERLSGGRYLTGNTKIRTDNPVVASYITGLPVACDASYGSVEFIEGMPQSVVDAVNGAFDGAYREHPEGYVILLDEDIRVYSAGLRGFIYAACDLTRMARDGFIRQGIVYNRPLADIRCLKLYLPPQENIEAFKRVVDLCCHYRCNTLIVEVGGAMEYRRHPEINEGWVDYCAEMHEYSGKTTVIQEQTFLWGKNSIHCENGGGKFLSQAQVRGIVDYCDARGIDVIPEMPTLSHCDYLLTRHHEFAERQNDPYADTYCPNAPGVYDYVLDVLDEVIDVFRPKTMHIGHDEYYSVGICERCRGKNAADIYADDVIRIHGHLEARGVRTMLWSEKLLNSIAKNGRPAGGAEKPFRFNFQGEILFMIPATYPAIERVPRDILCMHWYWSIVEAWDDEFLRRGFDMFYGNFDAPLMPHAAARLAAGALGGGPSNWSYATFPYLQENGALLSLAYASLLFWKDGMTDDTYTDAMRYCFEDLFRYHNRQTLLRPRVELTHTTAYLRPYRYHADGVFIDYGADTLGKYAVEYEDGSGFEAPIVYGQNIMNRDRQWTRAYGAARLMMGEEPDELDCECYTYDRLLASVAYSTLPVGESGETWFKYIIENPEPGKRIREVRLVEKSGMEGKVFTRDIRIIN